MSERCGELVATDKQTVVTESSSDATIVKDNQNGRSLANSASTNQNNRGEVFCETNDPFDQVVTSEEDPRWWRW